MAVDVRFVPPHRHTLYRARSSTLKRPETAALPANARPDARQLLRQLTGGKEGPPHPKAAGTSQNKVDSNAADMPANRTLTAVTDNSGSQDTFMARTLITCPTDANYRGAVLRLKGPGGGYQPARLADKAPPPPNDEPRPKHGNHQRLARAPEPCHVPPGVTGNTPGGHARTHLADQWGRANRHPLTIYGRFFPSRWHGRARHRPTPQRHRCNQANRTDDTTWRTDGAGRTHAGYSDGRTSRRATTPPTPVGRTSGYRFAAGGGRTTTHAAPLRLPRLPCRMPLIILSYICHVVAEDALPPPLYLPAFFLRKPHAAPTAPATRTPHTRRAAAHPCPTCPPPRRRCLPSTLRPYPPACCRYHHPGRVVLPGLGDSWHSCGSAMHLVCDHISAMVHACRHLGYAVWTFHTLTHMLQFIPNLILACADFAFPLPSGSLTSSVWRLLPQFTIFTSILTCTSFSACHILFYAYVFLLRQKLIHFYLHLHASFWEKRATRHAGLRQANSNGSAGGVGDMNQRGRMAASKYEQRFVT